MKQYGLDAMEGANTHLLTHSLTHSLTYLHSDKTAQYESFRPLSISALKDTIRITWSDLKQTVREAYNKQITVWSDQFNVLPGSIRHPIGAFLIFSLLLTFILLLVYGIENTLNFQSLSYSRYDPPNDQFVPEGCTQIPIDITGDFYADSNGYWSGSLNYQYTKAIYYTTLSNFADDSNGDSLTHSLTHSLTYLLTYLLTHSLTHALLAS
jgi:hypothetical protein